MKCDANDILREEGPDALREAFDRSIEQQQKSLNGGGGHEWADPLDDRPGPPPPLPDDLLPITPDVVTLEDFAAYMPMHKYIFTPTRELWPGASVNSRIPPFVLRDAKGKPALDDEGKEVEVSATWWLDRNKPVEQMTWAPGQALLIKDRLISEGGSIDRTGATVFNLYRPPTIVPRNANGAQRWIDHVEKIYPSDADHMIRWFAHRVQRPHQKINHSIVAGGDPGIGKDTMIEPVKRAVGPWNVAEVNPEQIMGRFNGYLKSVILRVSEAHDLGEISRFSFYEHMKALIAAPPDVLRCDEKNLREHSVPNLCGVIFTTNHKTTGIYLPANDRRHYVAWSDLKEQDFEDDYWKGMWAWYDNEGGDRDVAAYLAELDLSGFDPKAPPPKTPAFWAIVDANRAPEDSELADVLDDLENPQVTTLRQIQNAATGEFETWLRDRRNCRQMPHRFGECGYVPVRNDAAKDGLWVVNKRRQVVYAKADLSLKEQIQLAKALADAVVKF
jgi:hypothetical protein